MTTKTVTPYCSAPVSTTTETVILNCSEPASTTHIIQCSSAITTSTVTSSGKQMASTVIHHTTVTITTSTELYKSPSAAVSTSKCSNSVTPLGVLLGLMIAIIVVIIVGWVYTCWKTKNNGKAKPLFGTRSVATCTIPTLSLVILNLN